MWHFALVMAFTISACQSPGEEDHAHDASGGHITEGEEIPAVDATIWTDKTELFVEFPALVVGSTSRFAAHFTILDRHQPVREGSVTVSLVKDGKGYAIRWMLLPHREFSSLLCNPKKQVCISSCLI